MAFAVALPANAELPPQTYAPIVKRVAPAVVNIYAKHIVREQVSPFFNDPLFRQFFGGQIPGIPRERVQQSLGSGVVVESDGVIVTNNHVIQGAEEITVALPDRREFHARKLLADQRTDLAVLRIDTKGEKLPVVALRDSDQVEVGDVVLAIGNPFGVGQTVTSGIVSALARTQVGVSDYQFFIQTDAAINPGNSGGALVTTDGLLIGINSAIFSQSGGSIGIGFAIPSNMVRQVLSAALGNGTIARPWLGANGQSVTADLAAGLGLDRPGGVLLNEVVADGPAAKAGLKVGDVILAVDGSDIVDLQALHYRIGTRPLGGTARVDYWRDGKRLETTIALVKPPETVPRDTTEVKGANPFSGATVANLSPALAEDIGADPAQKGVVVTAVAPDSTAARLQLQQGDVIVKVEGVDITDVEALKRVLGAQRGQWRVVVRRKDQLLNVVVQG